MNGWVTEAPPTGDGWYQVTMSNGEVVGYEGYTLRRDWSKPERVMCPRPIAWKAFDEAYKPPRQAKPSEFWRNKGNFLTVRVLNYATNGNVVVENRHGSFCTYSQSEFHERYFRLQGRTDWDEPAPMKPKPGPEPEPAKRPVITTTVFAIDEHESAGIVGQKDLRVRRIEGSLDAGLDEKHEWILRLPGDYEPEAAKLVIDAAKAVTSDWQGVSVTGSTVTVSLEAIRELDRAVTKALQS